MMLRLGNSIMIRRVCWAVTLVLGCLLVRPVTAQTNDGANNAPAPSTPTPTTQVVQSQSFLVEYAIVGGLAGLALFAVCKSSRRV